MIPTGTKIAGKGKGSGSYVENILGSTYVYVAAVRGESSPALRLVSEPAFVESAGTSERLVRVDFHFSGCRDCLHKKRTPTVAFVFGESAEVLMVDGTYKHVVELENGHRVYSPGCKCGYEEVKSVMTVDLDFPTRMYTLTTVNFGVTDGKHTLIVRGTADE